MAENKKQHFVPQTYLKSWTNNNELYTLPKKNGMVRKQLPKAIAKKDNLYTITPDYYDKSIAKEFRKQELVSESIIFKIWEDRWPDVKKILEGDGDIAPVLGIIKGFVINQSIRTPKFMRLNKERINKSGISIDDISDATQFAMLAVMLFPKYIENCTCEILKSIDIANFITCDNPATHWEKKGDLFFHLKSITLNNTLTQNPNYKIICPIHPKYCVILSPNLGISISDKIKKSVFITNVRSTVVEQINRMVIHGSDKILFAKNVNDFLP